MHLLMNLYILHHTLSPKDSQEVLVHSLFENQHKVSLSYSL